MTLEPANFYAEDSFLVVRTGTNEKEAFDGLVAALVGRLPSGADPVGWSAVEREWDEGERVCLVSSADSEGWTYILTVETDPWFRQGNQDMAGADDEVLARAGLTREQAWSATELTRLRVQLQCVHQERARAEQEPILQRRRKRHRLACVAAAIAMVALAFADIALGMLGAVATYVVMRIVLGYPDDATAWVVAEGPDPTAAWRHVKSATWGALLEVCVVDEVESDMAPANRPVFPGPAIPLDFLP